MRERSNEFLHAESEFYGYHVGVEIAAVMEVKTEKETTHIQSLVVDPKYFRKGIASKLLKFLFDAFDSNVYTVETGAANSPAIALYKKFGFERERQWMTEIGIEKVGFRYQANTK